MNQPGLVERAGRGDHDAFAELVSASITHLLAVAQLILRDNDLAHDAVSDAYIRAWRSLPGLRDVDRFDAWLHGLTVNACLDAMRRIGRRPLGDDIEPLDRSVATDPMGQIVMKTGAFERDLPAWFAEVAPQAEELEEEILLETSAMSQRPRWIDVPLVSRPMGRSVRVALSARRTQVAVVLVALGLVLATVAAWVGTRPRLPAPFGPAANGLVAYEKAGDIFVVDPATGVHRAIALGPSIDRYPRWSRDGTRLAFLRGGDAAQLVVVDADGAVVSTTHGEPLTAMDPDGIVWSADGRQIALAKVGRIEIIDVETGDATLVPSEGYDGLGIQWRPPDGRELTFLASSGGRPSLARLDLESGRTTLVALAAGAELGVSLRPIGWTPDGRRFAYHRNDFGARETRVVDVESGVEVVLEVAFGRIANDGTRIVGLGSDGEQEWLCVAPTGGGPCQPIQGDPRFVDLASDASFQWAPDDRSIRTDPGSEPGVARLLDPDGGPVQEPEWAAEGAESWQRRSP